MKRRDIEETIIWRATLVVRSLCEPILYFLGYGGVLEIFNFDVNVEGPRGVIYILRPLSKFSNNLILFAKNSS